MGRLITAGLSFNKEQHKYLYNGKELPGITHLISKRLKKNFATSHVEEGRANGSHVHDAIEQFITTGAIATVHPDARWGIHELQGLIEQGFTLYSEVLVSDFKKFASAIDIVAVSPVAGMLLFDTKAGNFDREYVSWQLGIYKLFMEEATGRSVSKCYCLSTKYRDFYPIIPRDKTDVMSLLYGK